MPHVAYCSCEHPKVRHHGYGNRGGCSEPDCACLDFEHAYFEVVDSTVLDA